jgi:hypothetical protein
MHVIEIKRELPRLADKAKIEWVEETIRPRRDGKTIYLPKNRAGLYSPLREGKQFLVKLNDKYSPTNGVWFGGTDEEPFMVEIERTPFDEYWTSGSEQAFYQSLVPRGILEIAEENNIEYKRQGDIFAVKFCSEKYFDKNLARIVNCTVKEGETRILRTRHIGIGIGIILSGLNSTSSPLLFKGVIEAPDHAPLNLEDGFYLLEQTRYLVNPAQAD